MKPLHSIVLITALIFICQPAFSKQAATIDELVEMYDIKRCAECHPDKYEDWKTSTMGNSVVDPRVLRGMRSFIRLALDEEKTLKRKDLTICLNCHVPQIKDSSPELIIHIGDLILIAVEDKDEAKKEAAKKELSKLNLNCLGCHNLKATGFNVSTEEKVIYGPDEIIDNPHAAIGFITKKSDLLPTSDMCAQCHHCPPDVPWKDCPSLYTTYVDDFLHKGHNETCQDCHMKGAEAIHKFYGPSDIDFLKSSVSISVSARVSRYIDIYESRKMPALLIKVELTNKAGHVIPHGCAIMPKILSLVRVTDQNGKEVFSNQHDYSVGDLYFKGDKQVAMAEWDVTATEHFDLGLKPDEPVSSTFVVPLKADATSVSVEAEVKYLYTRDETFSIGKVVEVVVVGN